MRMPGVSGEFYKETLSLGLFSRQKIRKKKKKHASKMDLENGKDCFCVDESSSTMGQEDVLFVLCLHHLDTIF